MSFRRTFTAADQHAFARISGDWNPMHTDAVAARRTLFGKQVVHGVHTLLWALDAFGHRGSLARLEAKFLRGITLGAKVECQVEKPAPGAFQLLILADGSPAARVKGSFGSVACAFPITSAAVSHKAPVELPFAQATSSAGSVPLVLDEVLARTLFPANILPAWQTAAILATTHVVGMECPGLHSIYAGLTLNFSEPEGPGELSFAVATADPRFSSVEIAVSGPGTKGMLRALFRPPPQQQPGLAEAESVVRPGEFSGWRALVVGGSRGLGEVAGKLVAAGSGSVCLTYLHGAVEAQKISLELCAAGREAYTVPLDVTGTTFPTLPWAPTHVLYFATPFISIDRTRSFSPGKFTHLCSHYVSGFHFTISSLRPPLAIIYPSTVYLDETTPHLAEYCAAKAAGEELCRHFSKNSPGFHIHAPRLPRMLTDQTAEVGANELPGALPIILRELRVLSAMA